MRDTLNKTGLIQIIHKRLQALNPVPCGNCAHINDLDPINYDRNKLPKCLKCGSNMWEKCYNLEEEFISSSSQMSKNLFHICSVCVEDIKECEALSEEGVKEGKKFPPEGIPNDVVENTPKVRKKISVVDDSVKASSAKELWKGGPHAVEANAIVIETVEKAPDKPPTNPPKPIENTDKTLEIIAEEDEVVSLTDSLPSSNSS